MYQPRAGSARCQFEEHGRGSNGRWMMRLIYPHATNLETYLEHWLREMTTARPGSTASRAIREAGGPVPYLTKEHDSNDFKQVGGDMPSGGGIRYNATSKSVSVDVCGCIKSWSN